MNHIIAKAEKIETNLNEGQANSSKIRDARTIKIDNLSGVIAEYACDTILRRYLGSANVEKPPSETAKNQIQAVTIWKQAMKYIMNNTENRMKSSKYLLYLLILFVLLSGCSAMPQEIQAVSEQSLISEENLQTNEPELIPGESTEQPEEDVASITLIMVGDVLLHMPLQESGLMEDGSYNYDHFFAHTRELISAADLALVNQEVILGGRELGLSGYPAFNGAFEAGDALVNAGFDVVLHGTNHALDKGRKGVLNCLDFWENAYPDIEVLGIHESQEDQESHIFYYEKDGLTIAVLNYTYGTNGIPLPEPYMVDLLDEKKVVQDLQEADAHADFVIVAPHWGVEYTHTPAESETYWAEIFLENGVDLVIGTHPHVIQPVEWLEDEEGNRMLVYYSLGNFINFTSDEGDGVRQRAVGAMARVTITEEAGEAFIEDYDVVPLISHMVSGSQNPTVYPIAEYTEELAAENEMSRKDPKFTLEYCEDLCKEVFQDMNITYQK